MHLMKEHNLPVEAIAGSLMAIAMRLYRTTMSEEEFNKMKLASTVNEGWLYNKDRYTIKMFASYDKEEDGTLTFGDRTIIPLACIKKMTKIS